MKLILAILVPSGDLPDLSQISKGDLANALGLGSGGLPGLPGISAGDLPDLSQISKGDLANVLGIPKAKLPDISQINLCGLPSLPGLGSGSLPGLPGRSKGDLANVLGIPAAELPDLSQISFGDLPNLSQISKGDLANVLGVPVGELPDISEIGGNLPDASLDANANGGGPSPNGAAASVNANGGGGGGEDLDVSTAKKLRDLLLKFNIDVSQIDMSQIDQLGHKYDASLLSKHHVREKLLHYIHIASPLFGTKTSKDSFNVIRIFFQSFWRPMEGYKKSIASGVYDSTINSKTDCENNENSNKSTTRVGVLLIFILLFCDSAQKHNSKLAQKLLQWFHWNVFDPPTVQADSI
ncbi:hypothetical protein CEXT_63391 [Caerostris extrusa]|uniref:Uncharacterized protein n=1 Tax=Caerostris extrusa TaxID=172846 RepID=A0AAV4RZA7_CAEEX|nr:hypothetical protein CEXT_63391 [Caerostris extrusa]